MRGGRAVEQTGRHNDNWSKENIDFGRQSVGVGDSFYSFFPSTPSSSLLDNVSMFVRIAIMEPHEDIIVCFCYNQKILLAASLSTNQGSYSVFVVYPNKFCVAFVPIKK